jgi:hypothetical protein
MAVISQDGGDLKLIPYFKLELYFRQFFYRIQQMNTFWEGLAMIFWKKNY